MSQLNALDRAVRSRQEQIPWSTHADHFRHLRVRARPAGADQAVVWDGTDNLGSAAASGVYFYEARAMGDVRIGKTTLLK